jgi:alkaline phosphatase
MKTTRLDLVTTAFSMSAAILTGSAFALPVAINAPGVYRLTPPSAQFTFDDPTPPVVARFLPGQRFDLQATINPEAGKTITSVVFKVDGNTVPGTVTLLTPDAPGLLANAVSPTLRAYSNTTPGVHTFTVEATQSDSTILTDSGNFEVMAINTNGGTKAKNIIFCIGDGMGIGHRTAARIMSKGVQQGKALEELVTDTFPNTGIVKTASLNSIVTDSAPGAACYSSGNKANNNQEGVFPDDTTAKFDNPRVELVGEYLFRTQGKALGIVTTSDVFDATPAAFGVHTQDRGAGTGICDQFLDEATVKSGLKVLMGGGRKWFLPSTSVGSARANSSDYVHAAELATAWGVATGNATDNTRDLLADFQSAGFTYAPDNTSLSAVPNTTQKLLGLFSFSNMNVALDKINNRRGAPAPAGSITGNSVVSDYGFPDQPMLPEMTDKALQVLKNNPQGFVLMVEGASIDKQAHNMDTERWILDNIEFDNAVGVCKTFAQANPNTLVIVTADHECAGIAINGASTRTNAEQVTAAGAATTAAAAQASVGLYESAGFPNYSMAADGYPVTTDIDYRMVVGYAANADRKEDFLTNPYPLRDSQQPTSGTAYGANIAVLPSAPLNRDANGYTITGQVSGTSAAHTAADVPVYSYGRGSVLYAGTMDNTDVFFKAMQAAIGGSK